MGLGYKLRVCKAILTNEAFDVARRGVYQEDGLIVVSFGQGMRPVSDGQHGDGRTTTTLADGTTVDIQSGGLEVWAVGGERIR